MPPDDLNAKLSALTGDDPEPDLNVAFDRLVPPETPGFGFSSAGGPDPNIERAAPEVIARGGARGIAGIASLADLALVEGTGLGPVYDLLAFHNIVPPASHTPFTNLVTRAAEAAGLDLSQQAKEGPERFAEKLAEEFAAGAIPGLAVFRGARAAVASGRATGRIGGFLRAIAERPGAFAASEAASATGAATARAVAGDDPVSQITAGVVGGFAPGAVSGTARRVGEIALRSGREARGARIAAERLREVVGDVDRAVTNIDEATELAGSVAPAESATLRQLGVEQPQGAAISTAQATRDPGLLDLENQLGNRSPRLQLRLLAMREQGQRSVVEELARHVPEGDKAIADAVIDAQAETLAHSLDESIAIAQNRVRRAIEIGTRGQSPEDIAETTRRVLEDEAEKALGPARQAYRALESEADRLGATFDATPIRDAIDDLKREATQAEGVALPADLVQRMKSLGLVEGAEDSGDDLVDLFSVNATTNEAVPFRELQGLNRRLNREIEAASRDPRARVSVRALSRLKAGVGRALDAVEESSEFPEIAREFRRVNAEFGAAAERFRSGAVGKVLEPQRNPPAASATMEFFFKQGRGAREAARAYKNAVRNSVDGARLMEDYIVARAAQAAFGPDGTGNARRLQAFQRRYSAALNEFPEAQSRVRSLAALQDAADARALERTQSIAEFQKSTAALFAKRPLRQAVDTLLKAKDPVAATRELKGQLGGDADALQGAARAVWDELFRRAQTHGDLGLGLSPYLEPRTLRNLLDEFGPVIRELQGAEHIRNLDRIFDLAEIAFQGRIPRTARNQQRSILEGVPLGFVFNRIYGARTRVVRGALAAARVLENLDVGQANALLEEALVNPQLARDLLTRSPSPGLIRRLRGNLVSLGYRVDEGEGVDRQAAQ